MAIPLRKNEVIEVNNDIMPFIPMVEAVAKLFAPFVEVAVHDVTLGKMVAIYNNISKRNVGDNTPLRELGTPLDKFPDYFEPYYKTNWDGKQLKCTSISIKDRHDKVIGLICFNVDTTVFRDIHLNFTTFLAVSPSADNPLEMFEDDWKRKVDRFIKDYLLKSKTTLENLSSKQKKELVKESYKRGAFNYKNCALYLADLLKVSRASIYNYLK
ncbi:MAG: PAS domain-containing protein [Pseudomonadota bacterium]